MLSQAPDLVIGVNTHRDRHAFAVVGARTGEVICRVVDQRRSGRLPRSAERASSFTRVTRAWALEGCGAYGAGLRRHLAGAGERVVEAGLAEHGVRPKSDRLDAARAARAALVRARLRLPRADGGREALRVLMLARRRGDRHPPARPESAAGADRRGARPAARAPARPPARRCAPLRTAPPSAEMAVETPRRFRAQGRPHGTIPDSNARPVGGRGACIRVASGGCAPTDGPKG